MSWSDAVDSIYEYTKGRIQTLNPNRVVAGLLAAQDWPSKDVKFDAFYLLVLGETSIGKQGYSASTPIKFHQIQWVWINKGTDVKQGIRQANRGDRYRTMQAMKGELTNGLFPGFTEKLTWALDGNGIWTPSHLTPVEFIMWQPVEFHEKLDTASGMMYGSGAIRIVDMLDEIKS